MTVTNNERREVAKRLREVQGDVIPGTKTEVHPIAGRIIGVACGYDLPDFQGLLGRLADLIEPSPTCPDWDGECMAGKTVRHVDRDALLALADEMERSVERCKVRGYARRIRAACGAGEEDE